jgi:hypothetical protein
MSTKHLADTEIRERLGLLPRLDFLKSAAFNERRDAHLKWLRVYKAVTPSAEDFLRGSGRTTEMLIKALIALSEGDKVTVVGYDSEYTRTLLNDLVNRAGFLGLPTENIVMMQEFSRYNDYQRGRGYSLPPIKIFHDHYYKQTI